MGRAEVSRHSTPALSVVVIAALLLASTTMVLVTFATARAAGALAVGSCGAYGQAFDFKTLADARASAIAQCQGKDCKVVAEVTKGCSAFAVDVANPCGSNGWASGPRLGRAQNAALQACYKTGGKDCVIRTFLCDAKG
jgi:hypothetical protein